MKLSERDAPRGFRIRVEYPNTPLYRYGRFSAKEGWHTTNRKDAQIFEEAAKAQEGIDCITQTIKEAGAEANVRLEEMASFDPDWCTPPGGTIRECMEQTPMTEAVFAEKLGLPDVKGLLDGETVIDPELAQKLSQTIGGSQHFWLALDGNYREGLRKGLTVM